MSEPRAYTADETRDMILQQIKATVRYWANLPEVDQATGRKQTVEDRCDGVAFSILSMLDGATMTLPAFDLVPMPHDEDQAFHKANGENWFGPESRVSDMLHEHYSNIR